MFINRKNNLTVTWLRSVHVKSRPQDIIILTIEHSIQIINTASVHDVRFYLFRIFKADKLRRYTKDRFSWTQFSYIKKRTLQFFFCFHFSPICHTCILYSVWIVSTCLLKVVAYYFSVYSKHLISMFVNIDALKYDIECNYLQQYLQRFQ